MRTFRFIHILTLVFLIFVFSCTQHEDLGSEDRPIEISLIPSKEAGSLLSAGTSLKEWLETETGLKFNVSVPNSYIAVVEALGSKRADIAFLTTQSYAIARRKYGVEAQFISVGFDGKTTYRGQFLVHQNSKIKNLEQLVDKKIAYVDPSSASGYILPAYLLKTKNIKIKEFVFAGKHDSAVTMLYQKQVDAAAVFFSPPENGEPRDARRLIKTQFPDVFEKLKTLDYTEEISNDALVFRKDLPRDLKTRLQSAFLKWSQTDSAKRDLKALNNGAALKQVNDSHYEKDLLMLESMQK